jgi:hypothetical protein
VANKRQIGNVKYNTKKQTYAAAISMQHLNDLNEILKHLQRILHIWTR